MSALRQICPPNCVAEFCEAEGSFSSSSIGLLLTFFDSLFPHHAHGPLLATIDSAGAEEGQASTDWLAWLVSNSLLSFTDASSPSRSSLAKPVEGESGIDEGGGIPRTHLPLVVMTWRVCECLHLT